MISGESGVVVAVSVAEGFYRHVSNLRLKLVFVSSSVGFHHGLRLEIGNVGDFDHV
jgi:hypothetical protein